MAGEVIVELSACRSLPNSPSSNDSYLKATGIPVGMVLNFAGTSLTWQRIVFG